MSHNAGTFLYLVAGVLFILALRGLSSPKSSRAGNVYGMLGMGIAIFTTLLITAPGFGSWVLILLALAIGGGIGGYMAKTTPMTAIPQLVAIFHSLVGLAAVMTAAGTFYSPEAFGLGTASNIHGISLAEMSIGAAIGAITFSGSVVAFARLDGRISSAPMILSFRHVFNTGLLALLVVMVVVFVGSQSSFLFWIIIILALILGASTVIPIGGADMPVVISMLNSYSGWAAAGIGFTLDNMALIITGALTGSSGAILSYIMCKGMNRSFFSVILGGLGKESSFSTDEDEKQVSVRQGSAEDAAFLMKNASRIIIVPGYGMATAQAQHALKEMSDRLKAVGVEIKYAIHPVAGRMPGHMNVLLAEANVPYDEIFELEDINPEFPQTDVVFVIGANDVTNPAARDDPSSPVHGMPILEVDKAAACLFVKRSMGSGYAGIDNSLFYRDKTMMLLSDAKQMTVNIIKALE